MPKGHSCALVTLRNGEGNVQHVQKAEEEEEEEDAVKGSPRRANERSVKRKMQKWKQNEDNLCKCCIYPVESFIKDYIA